MSRVRTWVSLSLATVVVVLAAGWFLLISPEQDEAAAIREQALLQESSNAQAETHLLTLREKAERLPEQEAELADVARKIPDTVGLPDLLRALTAAATAAGVELVSVTPGAPAPLAPAAAAAVAGSAAAVPPGTAPGTAPAAPPAAPPAASAAVSTGVSSVPVALTVSGGYYDTEEFLSALEELPRAFRVTTLSVAPTGDATGAGPATVLTSSIAGVVYVTGHGAAAGGAAGATPPVSTVPAPAVTTEQQPVGAS